MSWRRLAHFMPEIPGFTHAALPCFHDGSVYFSPRDDKNRSHIYRAPFDPSAATIGEPELVLKPGRDGAFDDCGCSVSQVTDKGILYVGWNLMKTVPFMNTLARFTESREIVRQRDECNLSIHYGWEDGANLWYGSIVQWPMISIIHGTPALWNDELVCRPCVIGEEMWYCQRPDDGQYRLRHCVMDNGAWKRHEDVMIERSGFDSSAQCYPCVFDHEGARYMLYNGDGYGKTGFGMAIWE